MVRKGIASSRYEYSLACKVGHIFKWLVWLSLALLFFTLHDILWYSPYNPLFKDNPVEIVVVDCFIKCVILLVVYKNILPPQPSIRTIVIYSVMLSWLSLAQNLPVLLNKMQSVLFGVLLVHFKYALNFIQKFIIFRILDIIKTRLNV